MSVAVAHSRHPDAIVTFNVGDYALLDPWNTGLGIMVRRPGEMVRRLASHPSAISCFGFLRD